MAAVTTPVPVVGEHVRVSPLTLLVVAIALFGAYVMLQDNGLVLSNWTTVHELFHDGRHALGFPCH
ncbi:MAG TPA: CbtB-domain containing protein [Acidimicrobiales bacterium]